MQRTTHGQIDPMVAMSTPTRSPVMYEGWVLKKRRKKMQGFAKRYFTLHRSGILSYSFHPEEPVRDEVSLLHAVISTVVGRKDIHIDGEGATFHLKCLNTEDFDGWMFALRQFIPKDERATLRKSSIQRSLPQIGQFVETNALMDEIGSTIHELEEAFQELSQEDSKKKAGSLKPKGEKDKHKEHGKHMHSKEVFGIFKKSGSHQSIPDSISRSESSAPCRIQAALDSLNSQYAALAKSIASISQSESAPPSNNGSILPSRVVEEPDVDTLESPVSSPNLTKSYRTSTVTTSSDITWYDAPELEDGPQELLLDFSTPDEQIPRLLHSESHSMIDQDSVSTADTDSGDGVPTPPVNQTAYARRTQLPALPPADEGSLFTVLKKNVGKDLANVTLPVTFNEPLTLLQRAAEEMEYFDLLTQAAQATDPVERICYIAAFAVSGYAHTRLRSGRKGFNPMLAETFEDPRMKFIAEKVSHNPVIMAYHAEGEDWELYATSAGKTKFWGKSLEVIPLGVIHVKIGKDHFQWKKPSSFMRNLMVGTKYLEHCGKMTIDNVTYKSRCVLDFKESGYWASGNIVTGTVYSPSGSVEVSLEGKWDETFCRNFNSSHLQVLWRINPFPKNAMDYYGFTSFGITLNEITRDLERKLPPTDSRYRPDVRALENGDLDQAEAEKLRVEEAQRDRRRQAKDRTPRWFKEVGDEWIYVGGYWEERKLGWKDIQPLW